MDGQWPHAISRVFVNRAAVRLGDLAIGARAAFFSEAQHVGHFSMIPYFYLQRLRQCRRFASETVTKYAHSGEKLDLLPICYHAHVKKSEKR